MVWHKKILLTFIYRPLLIPLAVGGFGLWYGVYDISHSIVSKILVHGTSIPKTIRNRTLNAGVVSNITGITSGIVTMYMSRYMFPSVDINSESFLKLRSTSEVRSLLSKYSDVFKVYPFPRVLGAIFLSGSISATVSVCAERYLVG
jgi:hypothetical protein